MVTGEQGGQDKTSSESSLNILSYSGPGPEELFRVWIREGEEQKGLRR